MRTPVLSEFDSVSLGDRRLDRRLLRIAESLAAAPDKSFPEAMRTSDCEGAYRFFANEVVDHDDILAPHVAATLQRSREHRLIRVVHDTTALTFNGKRAGLGAIGRESEGFYAHVALAVGPGDERAALGALAMLPYVVQNTNRRKHLRPSERVALFRSQPRDAKHSSRWEKLAIRVNKMLPRELNAIHVMDREADDFTILAALQQERIRFVIRGSGDRITADEGQKLREHLSQRTGKVFRAVKVNRRPRTATNHRHPVRNERMAELRIGWAEITLARPRYAADAAADELQLSVVHVYERHTPRGEEPIEWILLTSERVESLDDATLVVDHYRARWVIEEFFKALKTGCAIEKRQLTTYDALLRALALFIPMAWHLLALRQLSRLEQPPRARVLFDEEQLTLLGGLVSQRKKQHVLPYDPTVRDALYALAAIGGHLAQNGDPGWLVLGRGYQALAAAEVGWRLARKMAEK